MIQPEERQHEAKQYLLEMPDIPGCDCILQAVHKHRSGQVLKRIHKLGLHSQQQSSELGYAWQDLLQIQIDLIYDETHWNALPNCLERFDLLQRQTVLCLCR